jgi:general secretion pathway protein C
MNAVSWLDAMGAPDRWRATLQSRGPQLAVWLLALAIGVQAALIVVRLFGAQHTHAPAAVAPAHAAPRLDIATITNAHVFGEPPVAQASTDAAHAPPSSIPLVLTGIIAARDPKDGMAIVGPTATGAKVYAVGDNISGGARLHAVYADRVLLERNGRLEALVLPRQFGSSTPARVASNAANDAERVRRLISEQPNAVAGVIRPQPAYIDSKLSGFRVYPGPNRNAFMQLGLRPGDLVTAINGTTLDDPARGDDIFRTLSSSSEARVTVMRNGHKQDLTLNMSQLASEADQLAGQDAGAGVAPPAASAVPPAGPAVPPAAPAAAPTVQPPPAEPTQEQ